MIKSFIGAKETEGERNEREKRDLQPSNNSNTEI